MACPTGIEFFNAPSAEVELPEPVDVITAEILGSFGLEENVLTFLPDRARPFLEAGWRHRAWSRAHLPRSCGGDGSLR